MAATQIVKTANGTAISVNGFIIDPTGATNGQTLVYNSGTGTFVPGAGGGGGSTGNWTFVGNNADLTGAGAMKIGNGTATSLVLGSATVTLTSGTTMTDPGTFTVKSSVANGASAVGIVADTTNTLSTAGARHVSFRNATGEYAFITPSGGYNGNGGLYFKYITAMEVGLTNSTGTGLRDGIIFSNSGMTLTVGGVITQGVSVSTSSLYCTDGASQLGDATHRFVGLYSSGPLSGKFRSASSTVTVSTTDCFVGVSGSGTRTVNLPAANTLCPGAWLVIQDVGNSAGTITINPNGTDNINGTNAAVTIAVAFGQRAFKTDGATNWYCSTVT